MEKQHLIITRLMSATRDDRRQTKRSKNCFLRATNAIRINVLAKTCAKEKNVYTNRKRIIHHHPIQMCAIHILPR